MSSFIVLAAAGIILLMIWSFLRWCGYYAAEEEQEYDTADRTKHT